VGAYHICRSELVKPSVEHLRQGSRSHLCTLTCCMQVQPKTFGYHEIFHAFTILASICHFSAVYIMIQQSPERLLHSR